MPDTRLCYINGQYIPEEDAKLSLFDSACLIGDSIQEVCRTFDRKIFRWPDHRDRMYRSLKAARIPFGMATEELDRITREFLERNLPTLAEGDEAGVGHLVSRGVLPLVLPATSMTFAMYFFPVSTGLKRVAKYYHAGRHVVTPLTRHMHPLTMDPKIKYRSRLHFSLADAEARLVDPEAVPLMLDHEGNLAEGTGWNFFLVRKGQLLTPTDRNILAGISRLTTLELARAAGLSVRECDLTPYDGATADEAFYTATSICMMPVTRFNGQPVGDGQPGPVTRTLMQRWKNYLGFDFEAHAHRMAASR